MNTVEAVLLIVSHTVESVVFIVSHIVKAAVETACHMVDNVSLNKPNTVEPTNSMPFQAVLNRVVMDVHISDAFFLIAFHVSV